MNEELMLDTQPVPVTVNRDVLRENLRLSPAARIEQGAFLANAIRGVITRADRFSPTLHSEIARILVDSGNRWMSTKELAELVNEAGLYDRSDRRPLKARDTDARTQNYSSLFERRGRRVRLAASAQPPE